MELQRELLQIGCVESIRESGPPSGAGIEKRIFTQEHSDAKTERLAFQQVQDRADE
jgi:hypothetical protein